MRFDFELQICTRYFSIPKMKAFARAVRRCKIGQDFFDLRFPWPKSSDFGPKNDDLAKQIFKLKCRGMVSKFKVLSTQASSSRTIDELDGNTALERRCDVASRPTRSRRSAGSVARL